MCKLKLCASQPSQCLAKPALGQEDAQKNDRVSYRVNRLWFLFTHMTRRSTRALGLSCQHQQQALSFHKLPDCSHELTMLPLCLCCACFDTRSCHLQVKPKRIRPQVEQRPLTQDELLAEAARTELDNLRDLEQMVALEEATKKKAMYKRSKYSGPMTRFHSKAVDNAALVSRIAYALRCS